MNKQLLAGLGVVVLLVAGFLAYKAFPHSTPDRSENETATTTIDQVQDNIPEPSANPNGAQRAWDVFERYMAAAKAHDLEALKLLAHQISPTCADPAKRTECNTLMDSAYAYGEPLKENMFKTIWADAKQIILLGDYVVHGEETSPGAGMFRPALYFTVNGDTIKLLAMNPDDGAILVNTELTFAEKKARLQELVKDTDEDGIANMKEECEEEEAGECKKTNPNRRDTDGDGWWDGIEIFFR